MRRLLIIIFSATLLTGACGGDDKKDAASDEKRTTTTAVGDTTSSTEASSGGPTTVVSGSGTSKRSTGTTPAARGGGPAPGPQAATPAGIKAAAPGTYTMKVTGTMTVGTPQAVNTTASVKVEPLQGTDQKTATSGQQGGSETVLRYQADGVYLVNLKLTGAVNKEFKLEPPALAFAQPATIGKAWTWNAKSTDGKTTVKSDFKILRTETIQIGGEAVPSVVVETNVVTDGDIKSTSKGTMWVSEAYRLIVREDTKMTGTYNGIVFSSDTSSVMQSTKPA